MGILTLYHLKRSLWLLGSFLLCLCLIPANLLAQEPAFGQFQIEDGLPSLEIYETHQDRSGQLWVATDKGVARYDGYDFQCFSMEDGLTDNSIMAIYEDHRGRIWFPAFSNGLAYFEKGEVHSYTYNDSLLKYIPPGQTDRIHLDESGTLWVIPLQGEGMLSIDPEGICQWHHRSEQFYHFVRAFADKHLLIGKTRMFPYKKGQVASPQKTQGNTQFFSFPYAEDHNNPGEAIWLSSGEMLIAYDSTVYLYDGNNLEEQRKFPERIANLTEDHQGQLWICGEKSLFFFPEKKLSGSPKVWFKGKGVCHVTQDREGGYWLASISNGLYYLPPLFWYSLPSFFPNAELEPVSAIDIHEGRLALGYFAGKVETRTSLFSAQKVNLWQSPNLHMIDIQFEGDQIWAGGYSKKVHQVDPENPFRFRIGRTISIARATSGTLLRATSHGFLITQDTNILYRSGRDNFHERIYAVAELNEAQTLLGTRRGVFLNGNDSTQRIWPEINAHVVDLFQGPKGSWWILTRGKGVIVKIGDLFHSLNTNDRLTSEICTRGFCDTEGKVWVGTNRGLNCIELLNEEKPSFSIRQFTHADGLPSDQINDLQQWQDTLVLATNRGAVAIPLDQLSIPKIAPLVQLQSIHINQREQELNQELQLAHDENEMLIRFSGISFNHDQNLIYRYKLEGQDQDWNYTTEREVRYTNLEPGSYSFYLSASKKGENWSSSQVLASMVIDTHYTDELWFRVSVVLGLLIFITGICYIIIQNRRTHERNKRNRVIAEQKALRAQMNPHFMFNSLNAIQLFVAKNQKNEANHYLSSFSQLMRQVMEYSGKRSVTLREELETLELYLSLEVLRLEDRITKEINIHPDLDPDAIRLPPMLIQPLIENAIWHGLTSKEGTGKLLLHFSQNEDYLVCRVEDNGIGRKRSREINHKRNSHHNSKGLENIKERLKLAFPEERKRELLQIEDLVNQGEPIGTRVSLFIPLHGKIKY